MSERYMSGDNMNIFEDQMTGKGADHDTFREIELVEVTATHLTYRLNL